MKTGRQFVYLLRHGKPDFPGGKSYIYGHTNFPLAREGELQAERAGHALAKTELHRIVSSDLSRASATAGIVAGLQKKRCCSVELDPALREINMGEWDGMETDAVRTLSPDLFAARGRDFAGTAAPGGETFIELQRRAVTAFGSILETSQDAGNILLVAHGGLFWTIVSEYFSLPLDAIFRFDLDFCALHLLEYKKSAPKPRPEDFRLLRFNWSPDLP